MRPSRYFSLTCKSSGLPSSTAFGTYDVSKGGALSVVPRICFCPAISYGDVVNSIGLQINGFGQKLSIAPLPALGGYVVVTFKVSGSSLMT